MKPFTGQESVTINRLVTDAMTVHFDELGPLHPVYSTYTMTQHFEEVGRMVLLPHLEPGEDGIGSAVEVEHLASALVGMNVTLRGTFERLEGRRVYCKMEAWNELGDLMGRGRTVQIVLPTSRIHDGFALLRERWEQSKASKAPLVE